MKDNRELSEAMDAIIRKRVPEWKVIAKETSTLHKVISWLPPVVFLRTAYRENFWTTLGYTAAHPIGQEYDWDTRPHEGLHAQQASKWTRPLFGFGYLFPQALFLPIAIFLCFFLSWWMSALAVAVSVAPWPAPFRMLWELEAYELSVMVWEWQWGQETEDRIEDISSDNFAGVNYWFMWPFTGYIKRRLRHAQRRAEQWKNIKNKDPYINEVYLAIKDGGRLAAKYQ